MNNASHTLRVKIPAAVGILLITLIVVGAILLTQHDTAITTTTAPTVTNSLPMSNVAYKDGTYMESGSYSSPAGTESLAVTLSLANGQVTSSMVTRGANDPTASSYQSLFISGYKAQVEGKKISDIKLTNVAGSSLTPNGFMDALHKIEIDAKA